MDENRYTFENPEFKDTYRHTTSHILAQAVKRLYPEVKLAIATLTRPLPSLPRYSRKSRPRCARSARKR